MIKSYHMFLGDAGMRWLVYVGYPVLLILCVCWMGRKLPVELCVVFCCSMIVVLEMVLDLVVFGGIAAKDTIKLEYIKTSAKGMKVLRDSLIGDGIRRFVTVVAVMMIIGRILTAGNFDAVEYGFLAGMVLLLSELPLLVGRRFSNAMLLIITASFMGGFTTGLVGEALDGDPGLEIVCFLLYLVIAGLQRMMIMRRARKSYYDGRD